MSPAATATRKTTTTKTTTGRPRAKKTIVYPVTSPASNPRQHFLWNRPAFESVIATLNGEAKRLRQFGNSCPTGRANDLTRLTSELASLLAYNPPNSNGR